jgi:hypothetical protein
MHAGCTIASWWQMSAGVCRLLCRIRLTLLLLLLLPQVGSTTGVGLAEGRRGAVKWSQLAKMFAGWVFTLIIGGVISGVLFAWVSAWSILCMCRWGQHYPCCRWAHGGHSNQHTIIMTAVKRACCASLQLAHCLHPHVGCVVA